MACDKHSWKSGNILNIKQVKYLHLKLTKNILLTTELKTKHKMAAKGVSFECNNNNFIYNLSNNSKATFWNMYIFEIACIIASIRLLERQGWYIQHGSEVKWKKFLYATNTEGWKLLLLYLTFDKPLVEVNF